MPDIGAGVPMITMIGVAFGGWLGISCFGVYILYRGIMTGDWLYLLVGMSTTYMNYRIFRWF